MAKNYEQNNLQKRCRPYSPAPRNERGIAFIQFIVIFPIIFLLYSSIVTLGFYLIKYHILTRAVHEGVMFAAFAPDLGTATTLSQVEQRVRDSITTYAAANSIYTIDLVSVTPSYDPVTRMITVVANCNFRSHLGWSIRFRQSATGPYLES